MSAIAYAPFMEDRLAANRAILEAEAESWAWRVHPTEPDMLIVSRGAGHGEYAITDWACGCPAGAFGRNCCHAAELARRFGDVDHARRELSCR